MKQIRPTYYRGKDGTELIDVFFNFGIGVDFCIANVVKYVLRARNKNGIEDLKKARTYLDLLIDNMEMQEETPENTQPMEEFGDNNFYDYFHDALTKMNLEKSDNPVIGDNQ